MTVYKLESAKEIVEEDPTVLAVYEYKGIGGETLWSIEHDFTAGCTESSPYVISPKLIYTREGGWSK